MICNFAGPLYIETDILKGLYESLIDPAQRRELGEFYTAA